MRAQEFINESSKMPKSHVSATPDMRTHPGLDNSSPYAPWRFAAHFLAGADGKNPYEHEPDKNGPNGQKLVTISYTDEEEAMIRQAERAFGSQARAKELTPRGSTEAEYVQKTSPIKGFKGYVR
jgi:hypothetical protein